MTMGLSFKSFGDLSADIARNLAKVPVDVDLIVGIPRSGLMAASILALALNKKFCDLGAFIENRPLQHGATRRPENGELVLPHQARVVMIIDDSVDSGVSIAKARATLAPLESGRKLLTAAVYASERGMNAVDIYFERVDLPRVFAWNLFHRNELAQACVDIDGVLCSDPTAQENDDGPRYLRFLENATPIARPSYKIGHLVTSRLERYRQPTLAWLNKHAIRFEQLHMLNVATAEERRRLSLHGEFKAGVYRSLPDTTLFIESEPAQAAQIATLSGKPVLDYTSQKLVSPSWNAAHAAVQYASIKRRIVNRIQRVFA
jgi:uncharacterized HAD superfamily protein